MSPDTQGQALSSAILATALGHSGVSCKYITGDFWRGREVAKTGQEAGLGEYWWLGQDGSEVTAKSEEEPVAPSVQLVSPSDI